MEYAMIKDEKDNNTDFANRTRFILFGIWWNIFYCDSSRDSFLVCIAYQSYVDTQEYADTRKSLVSRRITEIERQRKEDERMGSIKRWVKEENANGRLFIRNSLIHGHNMELVESFRYIVPTFNGSFIVSIGNWSTKVYLTLTFSFYFICALFICNNNW